MAALGHDPDDPLACLVEMECSFVWKLVDVKEIIALKELESEKIQNRLQNK